MSDESRESFRKVADLLAHRVRVEGMSSVLFTGATPGAGTTTSAVHIAEEMVRLAGLRVLLVELNLRRPCLAKKLGLNADQTLTGVLDGRRTLAESVFRTTSGLDILAAPESGGTDLSTQLIQSILNSAGTSYDIVLVDTPPILGYSDTMVLAGVVPRVVVVVEAGRSTYEVIERLKRELATRQIDVVGAIVNKHRRFIPGWIYRLFAR